MSRRLLRLALLIACASLPALRAAEAATTLPPTPWQEAGPNGTLVFSLVFDPDHSGVIFAGVAGGVYRSTDGGASWKQVFAGREDARTFSLAMASGVLYAGTYPYGLYKSLDSGETWQPSFDGYLVTASKVVIDPAHPRTVYARWEQSSLMKSTDGGIHWTSLDAHLPAGGPGTIAVDGGSPSVVYLSTLTPARIWRSVDGGLTWTASGPPLSAGVQMLAVDPLTHKAYAATQAAGLLASTDRGLTWRPVSGFPAGLSVNVLASRGKTVYAGTLTPAPEFAPRGLFASLDGGVTWHPSHTGLETLRVFSLAIDPRRAGAAVAGIDYLGVLKTVSSGGTWAFSGRGLSQRPATRIVRDPSHPGTFYAGTNGTGVWKSVDRAHTWTLLDPSLYGFIIRALAVDPRQPGTVYAGSDNLLWRSRNGGVTWSSIAHGLPSFTGAAFLIDPRQPFILYLGTQQGVYRSTDRGATWSGPAAGTECFLPLIFTTSTDGTVFAGGVDCGSGNGKVLASTDSGLTWEDRSGAAPLFWPVFALIADPQSPSTLYASSHGGMVVRSTDGGSTWKPSTAFGDSINTVRSMAWFPGPPSTLYIGILGGVLSSIDGGVTWQRAGRSIDDGFLALDLIYDPAAGLLYAATPWGVLAHPAGVP